MGKAIPYAYREKIILRRKAGESYKSISMDLGYSESGIKKIWYKYQKEGENSLKTQYKNCGSKTIYGASVREAVDKLRDNEQGSHYIYSKLLITQPNLSIPSARTLRRWWVKEQTNRKQGKPTADEKRDGANTVITLGK